MLFLQPMPMDDVAAANRPVAAEVSVMKARARAAPAWNGMRLAQAPGGSPAARRRIQTRVRSSSRREARPPTSARRGPTAWTTATAVAVQ